MSAYLRDVYLSFFSQKICKQLHSKIDVVDEERYDCEYKVGKHNKDVSLSELLPAPSTYYS